jgi:hypothetical protein
MSAESRLLNIGDFAFTDYNHRGKFERVQIVDVDRQCKHGHSQSGVMFKVIPLLKHGTLDCWYCADWFCVENSGQR